jgi:hydrogenase expression/formation protein HypC
VLVFLDVAREVLQPERAEQIKKAIGAVAAVMNGDSADFDDLFADLVEREPQLPEHLQTK